MISLAASSSICLIRFWASVNRRSDPSISFLASSHSSRINARLLIVAIGRTLSARRVAAKGVEMETGLGRLCLLEPWESFKHRPKLLHIFGDDYLCRADIFNPDLASIDDGRDLIPRQAVLGGQLCNRPFFHSALVCR